MSAYPDGLTQAMHDRAMGADLDLNELQRVMEEAAEDEARSMARPFREWLCDTMDWRGGALMDCAESVFNRATLTEDWVDNICDTRARLLEDYTQHRIACDSFREQCAQKIAEEA